MLKILKKLKLNTRHRRYPASAIPGIILTAIIIVAGLLYIFNKPVVVEAEWWNDGWRYRQTITITNGGTAQTDFQIAITDDTAALVTAGKLQSDCDDIRITDIAGNVLPHWIETGTCNTVTTEIWTKLASIPTTATTLYLYYGNPSATSVESGTNVFIFFDDFSNGLGKWTPTGSEIFSISSGVLNITPASSNQYLIANQSIGTNGFVIETEMKSNHTTGSGHPGVMWHANTSTGSAHRNDHVYVRPHSYNTTSNIEPAYYNGALQTFTDITGLYNYNTWYEIKIELVNANSVKYYRDGVNEANWANQQYQSNTYVGVAVHSTNNQQWDDYRVRKYAATEPVAGSPISEEKGPGPIAYWKFDEGYGNAAKDSVRSSGYIANATGGTITEVGGYRIHTFTTSGTFTPTTNGSVEVLIVAGGGGGSENIYDDGSGGGGGGFITTTTSALAQGYTVTVGAGGAIHTNGDNSSVFGLTAIGGGRGASHRATNTYTGGSGGGAGGAYDAADGGGDGITDGGSGTPGQGYDGGTNTWASGVGYAGAGGGGAGGFGFSSGSYIGGDGGPGKVSSISGTATYYAGGGGGYGNSSGGTGGIGGGGTCVNPSTVTTAGGANTGGGGAGGSTDRTSRASAGGSGIVIIRYPVASSDGVVSGATWQTEDMCVSGKCLYFDGTNDYVDTGTGPKPTSAITMTAWVRPTVVDGAVHNVIDHHNGYEFQERDDSNWRTYINLSSSSWQSAICTSVTVQPNQWYFISGTYDSSTGLIKTYVDGDFCESTGGFTGQTIAYSGTDKTAIGGMNDATGRFFEGFIDEVKIYEYERSAAQIKADYLSGQSGSPSGVSASFGGGQQQGDSEGLVGYWKMDEASGNAEDSSGNGRTGTAFGTGSWEAGKYGNSYGNDGNHSGFELGTAQILPDGSDATLSFWAKVNADFSNSYIGIFTAWGSSGPNTYWYGIRRDTGATGWGMHYNDATNSANIMGASLTIGQWHHYSFVVDGTARRLYFDGNFIGEATSGHVGWNDGARTSGTSGTMRTVGVTSYASYLTDHNTDDVRLYNVARTADQIMRDYKQGPPPVAYYNFEEGSGTTLYDKSGNGYNSSAFGGSSDWALGKNGGALDFDGTSDYVTTSVVPLYNTDWTINFWYKSNEAKSWPTVFKQSGSNVIQFAAGHASKELAYWYSSAGIYGNTSTLPTGVWRHASAVYDHNVSKIKFYLNGISDSDWQSVTSYTATNTVQQIGYWGSTQNINGKVDDLKIYNYARTPEQILWDMHGDEAPHPIAYWNFDEGYGTSPQDSSGNNEDINSWANGPVWTADGKFGNAIDLSANGAQVNDSTFNYGVLKAGYEDRSWTLAVWTKPGSAPDFQEKIIFGRQGHHGGILANQTNFEFQIRNNVPSEVVSITKTITSWNEWHYLTATYDNRDAKFYVNGDLVGTDTMEGTFYAFSDYMRFGYNDPYDYNGIIDEAKIFNFALSPEQVRQEYNQGSQVSLGQQKSSSETWDAGGFGGAAPIGYWNFEEGSGSTVYDRSANSNNGTITAATYTLGKPGSGLSFDGTDDYVSVPYNTAFSPTTAVTVEAWVKMDDPTTNARIVSKTEGSGYTLGTTIDSVADQNFFVYRNGTYGKVGWSNTNFSSNTWYHMAGTYDGRYMKFYVNGSLKDADDAGGTYPIVQISNNLCFGIEAGATTCTNSTDFSGKIDEVKIFNYARSQAQIAYDYNGGKPVGWWPLDDGEGLTAIDISGNGNAGTLDSTMTNSDWIDGVFEGALDFDGSDDFVNIPDPADGSLDFGTGPFTVLMWVNSTTQSCGRGLIAKGSTFAAGAGWSLTYACTPAKLYVLVGNSSSVVQYNTLLDTISSWKFLGIVRDESNNIYFINDDKYTDTGSNLVGDVSNSNPLLIGKSNYNGAETNGQIDDVRVYNYALTADQVKEVMNNGSIYIK